MLPSPYANVFFYFRGPSAAGDAEPTVDSLARRAYRDAEVAWLASADPVTLRYP